MNPRDYRISCEDRVPSTLLVNHESHEACRVRYTLSFATFGNVHGPPVYFDFSRDVISLSKCGNFWWTDFNEIFNRDLSSVKRVMVDDDGGFGVNGVPQLVVPFHELRSIGMVREIYLPPLSWQEENHLLSAFKAQIKRENLQDHKHKVLEKLEVYFSLDSICIISSKGKRAGKLKLHSSHRETTSLIRKSLHAYRPHDSLLVYSLAFSPNNNLFKKICVHSLPPENLSSQRPQTLFLVSHSIIFGSQV